MADGRGILRSGSRLTGGVLIAVLAGLLMIGGCASEEVRELQVAAAADEPADDAFTASVTLCRKVGSKSGRRIGIGTEFACEEKAWVRAFADFANVRAGRTYTAHLVWIRPDGQELFRRYAEVTQEVIQPAAESEGYRTVITWRDAEDLHKSAADTVLSGEPGFTVESRFNISTEKERELGEYRFRVYLDRALLLEKPFTLVAAEPAG